jgi:hypothetical protein
MRESGGTLTSLRMSWPPIPLGHHEHKKKDVGSWSYKLLSSAESVFNGSPLLVAQDRERVPRAQFGTRTLRAGALTAGRLTPTHLRMSLAAGSEL